MAAPLHASPILLVAGPTASGKSALGVRLARELHGEVVNIDSVQVYRDFSIGSAKTSAKEQGGIPHHLIDIVSPDEPFSVAHYLDHADSVIASLFSRGVLPVFVGGTGMYIRSLIHGIADLPRADAALRRELEGCTDAELGERLRVVDEITSERLHPNDRVRIIRALESFHLTGVKPSTLQESHGYHGMRLPTLIIVPCWGRDELYRRIDERSAAIVRDGLVEESAELLRRYGDAVSPFSTIGYSQALRYLRGKMTPASLVEEISQATRNFAKRQMTYWRNEPGKRGWCVRPREGEGEVLSEDLSGFAKPSRIKGQRVLLLSIDALVEEVKRALLSPDLGCSVWFVNARNLV